MLVGASMGGACTVSALADGVEADDWVARDRRHMVTRIAGGLTPLGELVVERAVSGAGAR